MTFFFFSYIINTINMLTKQSKFHSAFEIDAYKKDDSWWHLNTQQESSDSTNTK